MLAAGTREFSGPEPQILLAASAVAARVTDDLVVRNVHRESYSYLCRLVESFDSLG